MAISNNTTGLRTGVCTSTTRPTAPYEGQMIYETDTDLTYVYNGSSWQQVSGGTAVGNSGLVFVKSQTIGSAVSSVTVSDAFSATYDNYLIQVSGGAVSTQNELRLQMSGTTSGYYYQLILGTWSATIAGEGSKIATEWLYTGMGATNGLVMNCQVYLPYLATRTRIVAPYFGFVGDVGHVHGQLDNATQYTGFVIKTSTGTMTGGTIRVYGYRNS